MKSTGGTEKAKRNAGESAAELVEDGMVVGLGTGSTAAEAIKVLGERVREEVLDIRAIPTSYQSRQLAIEEGIPLTSLDVETPDIDIDGADQFDSELNLVKGGGAAHAREKVVAESSDRVVIVADKTKYSQTLDYDIFVEALDFSVPLVKERLEDLGGNPSLRQAEHKDGPIVSDNGNLILDVDFGEIHEPYELSMVLSNIPAVVEHGLFVDIADEVHMGREEKVEVRR